MLLTTWVDPPTDAIGWPRSSPLACVVRTNTSGLAAIDDVVAGFNPTGPVEGKTIISGRKDADPADPATS